MNWMQKLANKSLVDEIRSWGWTEDQLRKDGVSIYKQDKDNKFFISVGDWGKVNIDDLKGAIGRVYPDSEIDWDYETGPPEDWDRIF